VIRRSESHLAGALGHTLFRRIWLPAEPERVLLLAHGFGEHAGRYEPFGAWFAQRGCAVHAYDHQGHGRSDGPRCHVRRFEDFLDDLDLLQRVTAEEHPGLPFFIVGHSMGGLIVAAHARERHPDVSGVVLSGAALAVAEAVSPARRWTARLLRRVAPRLTMAGGVDPDQLSRDPEVVRAYVSDPLVSRKMTVSLGWELLNAAERTLRGGADVKAPMLILHGEEDALCPARGSRVFYEQLTVAGRELQVYPGLRHEIFNEPEREEVFSDVERWLLERSP
jgi:alpha-beta hydrolase superfamily lysophospholipase